MVMAWLVDDKLLLIKVISHCDNDDVGRMLVCLGRVTAGHMNMYHSVPR